MNKEIVTVTTNAVSCEGNGPVTGHPKVYLAFKPGENEIMCPYCSRIFQLKAGARTDQGH